MGPDEYHSGVDDNAYPNLMARWNLRSAVEAAAFVAARAPSTWTELEKRLEITKTEIGSWPAVAGGLVDGLDRSTGLIEQFADYRRLEHLDLAAMEPRTVPVDVLLGSKRVEKTQVLKQADVVMAFYLLWEEFPDELRMANFLFYEPRTAHGRLIPLCWNGVLDQDHARTLRAVVARAPSPVLEVRAGHAAVRHRSSADDQSR